MTPLGELLFVAAGWGVPLALLWISWHRYGAVHAAAGTNRSFAGASFALLFLSSGIWLLLYGSILLSEYFNAINSILGPLHNRLLHNPTALAVANIVICFVSFFLSLLMPKTVQGIVPFQRAITIATAYMLLIWIFALTAH